MTLPILKDISPTKGLQLDEKIALDNFLGKNQEQASKLFFKNALYYSDDLIFMGGKGFAFYFPALLPYIQSVDSNLNSDVVDVLIVIIEARIDRDLDSIKLASTSILEALNYCLENYEKFGVDISIYGNLEKKMIKLINFIEDKIQIEE